MLDLKKKVLESVHWIRSFKMMPQQSRGPMTMSKSQKQREMVREQSENTFNNEETWRRADKEEVSFIGEKKGLIREEKGEFTRRIFEKGSDFKLCKGEGKQKEGEKYENHLLRQWTNMRKTKSGRWKKLLLESKSKITKEISNMTEWILEGSI